MAPTMLQGTTRAGAYRLIEHIASGGMGVVYLAERDDGQVRHQAAVKILRRGLDAEDQVRRFVSERQILASLDHPNIARLVDAGLTDDHRPYLVMEYVQGEPIDRYCDRRRLTVGERVALMRDVARAVDYAHRNLVVHRDLKPSNILVTDEGRVKLLDFGIAKLLDTDPEGTTSLTMPGVRLMTPGYASPEQITGGHITTATDVYVLGLLLYELLTGTRAQDTTGLSVPEVERLVVDGTLPRPSDAVVTATSVATTGSAAADNRGTTPGRLKRRLRGDLDRIVAMAVRKEPERRYTSAAALAADLDRYLRGQPVLARGESVAYRFGKFVRRRWPAVAAAVLFLTLLISYAVTVTLQTRQIAAERDRAQAARNRAEEVSAFLVGLFQASDPGETRGDAITARELLTRGVERVDGLNQQPEVQAQLLDVIGRVHQSLGGFAEARPLLERALATRRAVLGEDDKDVGDSLTHLGDLLRVQGRYPEAEETLRQALAVHQRTVGRETAAAAQDLHLLGVTLVDRGDRQQARQLLEEALAIRRRVLRPDDPDIAESLSGLAYTAAAAGDYEEMEKRYAEALALLRQAFGTPHGRVALGLNNLAAALDNRGRYDESARLHREALAMRRQIYGEAHPAVATSLNNLSNVLQKQEKYDEAEPLIRKVVALRRKLLGDDHPSTGTSLNNLAVLLFRSGRPKEAEPILREARALAVKRLPPDHPALLAMDTSLAAMIAAQRRDAEAEALFRRTHETRIRVLGRAHPDVANGLLTYGRFLAERRRFTEAEPMLVESHAMRMKLLGPKHPDTARSARELAALLRSVGRSDEARALDPAHDTK